MEGRGDQRRMHRGRTSHKAAFQAFDIILHHAWQLYHRATWIEAPGGSVHGA
jgi:hypothetical protein